ncbi:MAG: hypothetical protein K6T29_04595 [Peptococcaceae bacterium]|nr:hypothetical protein [Peptococcaceae bacterium]
MKCGVVRMFREAAAKKYCTVRGREVEITRLYTVEKGSFCPISASLIAWRCREEGECAARQEGRCPLAWEDPEACEI